MFLVSLRFLRAAHTFHCFAGYFFFPSPPPIFSGLCILKSPESLPGGSCLDPFSGSWGSSELDTLQFWTSEIQDLLTSCRKFLYFTLFLFSVLYTKNVLKSTQFSRSSTTFFWPFYSFLQNWVITEVLVCPVYILYEYIVLDNSLRLLYFHVCLSVFPPFVYNCCIMDRTYHLQTSCPSTLAPLCHHSSWTLTSLFQALTFPF